MNRQFFIAIGLAFSILFSTFSSICYSSDAAIESDASFVSQLSAEELAWIDEHKHETIEIGLDPNTGVEYFWDGDGVLGYMVSMEAFLSEKLGLKIKLVADLSWSQTLEAVEKGDFELLFGANPTPERLKIMDFTEEIFSMPYVVIGNINGAVQNIGDLHGARVGFVAGDAGEDLFKSAYPNLRFNTVYYENQEIALSDIQVGMLDAIVTTGGDIVYDYLMRYSNINVIATIDDIRSLMTFAALKENHPIISILSKLQTHYATDISAIIKQSKEDYILKVLNLSEIERQWLAKHPSIKVGVPTDYLPIDYYSKGRYVGIAGHYFSSFADLIGLEIETVPNSFDTAYHMILSGEIDVLNMAKTESRLFNFVFTEAFSNDRDQIYGRRNMPYVHDVYGLENYTVAVIEGFWHIQYLERNLRSPNLYVVKDIREAIEAVVNGKADYFIEMPAVAEYYTSGLGYTEVIKKGETSADSYLYFGMLKEHAPLVSIFNRAKRLLDFENSKYLGVQGLPKVANVENRRLAVLLVAVSLLVAFLVGVLMKYQKNLILKESEMVLLKERERMIYIDPLTGLYNRNYFNQLDANVDERPFPQAIAMLDINDLKAVNDRFGHLYGDRLIIEVSGVLKRIEAQFSGIPIRMGGDEFVLLFFGLENLDVKRILNDLDKTFKSTALRDGELLVTPNLNVAMGCCVRPDATLTFEACLKTADDAMYKRKKEMKA